MFYSILRLWTSLLIKGATFEIEIEKDREIERKREREFYCNNHNLKSSKLNKSVMLIRGATCPQQYPKEGFDSGNVSRVDSIDLNSTNIVLLNGKVCKILKY